MNWWSTLYDDLAADVFLVRENPAELEETVHFIVEKLELAPGARVFDQCCGIGGLSIPLAKRGFAVTGVDQAAAYVERARRDGAGLGLEVFAADAGTFRTPAPQAGAFNWWTSFGYSPDDRENQKMFDRAYESLVPGGRFLLETMNLPEVVRNFQSSVVTRRGDVVLLRESELDLTAGLLHKRFSYFLPNGERRVHDSSIKIYLPHTLKELLTASGFEVLALFGGTKGEPLKLDTKRCIVLARRPAK